MGERPIRWGEEESQHCLRDDHGPSHYFSGCKSAMDFTRTLNRSCGLVSVVPRFE